MKQKTFYYTLFWAVWGMYACNNEPSIALKDLKQYTATEKYPEDTLLQKIETKKAMIVIAHDDDMCAMSGTISSLNQKGWEIAVISLSKTPERNVAQIKACRHILDTVMFLNFKPEQYRNDLDKKKTSYYAIAKADFPKIFKKSILETELIKQIQAFNPSIIFSLDNEMGGYGHAEHVLVSQMVVDLKKEKRINPKYIYQSVYPKSMESAIMKRHAQRMKSWGFAGDEWDYAKKVYEVNGMPEPNVQINITRQAQSKMDYLRSYNKREREVLGFFIPAFEQFSAEEYFNVFDREFFRIIE